MEPQDARSQRNGGRCDHFRCALLCIANDLAKCLLDGSLRQVLLLKHSLRFAHALPRAKLGLFQSEIDTAHLVLSRMREMLELLPRVEVHQYAMKRMTGGA